MSERPEGTEEIAPGRGAKNEFLVEDDDALAALVNLIAVLGDNQYFLGRRVSEWADAAPLLESAAACAAITQDNHYIVLAQSPKVSVYRLSRMKKMARRTC